MGALAEGANEGFCEKSAERIPEISYYAVLSTVVVEENRLSNLSNPY
jgi:hypothetical protein